MENLKAKKIYAELSDLFPNAHCALNYHSLFQLVVAVSLSAQTTDQRVNMVTEPLFAKYPTSIDLSKADVKDVEEIIRSLGLAKTKARNIISLSKTLEYEFGGEVPSDIILLKRLAGVGQKTANVVLSEGFHIPSIAVDTHVKRVANRLGLAHSSDPLIVEKELKDIFLESEWSILHHRMIFFGRQICHAKNPDCLNCPFIDICVYDKKKTK
ncbi:MAG: endonuclease III [Bacilli bacterium]